MIAAAKVFQQALDSRAIKTALPTDLSSRQLATIAPQIRERALFSSRVANAQLLQEIGDRIDRVVAGSYSQPGKYMDKATFRLEMGEILKRVGYTPKKGKEGTIQDLSSDKRLNLIHDMQVEHARGYGQFEQANDPDTIDLWPCQELVRIHNRKIKRDWSERWKAAGGKFFGGRMIARKDDPVWSKISVFGLPYPPFDFGSGMGVAGISRKEAIRLGVISKTETVQPQTRQFNDDLQMQVGDLDSKLKTELMRDVGDVARFESGVLIWKGGA